MAESFDLSREGPCPHCGTVLILTDEDLEKESTQCPDCNEYFTLEQFKEDAQFKRCPYCNEKIMREAKKCKYCQEYLDGRSERKEETAPDNAREFADRLSTFRIYVLLSIFLDFFFIFTILCFSQRGSLIHLEEEGGIRDSDVRSFRNWDALFIIVLILEIIGLCVLFSPLFLQQ